MSRFSPYRPGQHVMVLHSCEGRGTELAKMRIERVVPLNTNKRWRIEMHRCDGTPLAAVVDERGSDAHGYVTRCC